MSMELKVDKDRVLKIIEKFPQAKEELREIFPEAFEEKIDWDRFNLDIGNNYIDLKYKGFFILTIGVGGVKRYSGLGNCPDLPLDEKGKIKIKD